MISDKRRDKTSQKVTHPRSANHQAIPIYLKKSLTVTNFPGGDSPDGSADAATNRTIYATKR